MKGKKTGIEEHIIRYNEEFEKLVDNMAIQSLKKKQAKKNIVDRFQGLCQLALSIHERNVEGIKNKRQSKKFEKSLHQYQRRILFIYRKCTQ